MINYATISEFEKDFKRLSKRFKTLPKDFDLMKRASIEALYELGKDNSSIVKIEGFCGESYTSNKVRKFSCMSLKGRGAASGLRVIFVWEESKRQVTFIEIYFKGDKENEDKERLSNFIKVIEDAEKQMVV